MLAVTILFDWYLLKWLGIASYWFVLVFTCFLNFVFRRDVLKEQFGRNQTRSVLNLFSKRPRENKKEEKQRFFARRVGKEV